MPSVEALEQRLFLHGGHGDSGEEDAVNEDYGPAGSIQILGDWDGDRDLDAGTHKKSGENALKTIYWIDLNDDGRRQRGERFAVRGRGVQLLVTDWDNDWADEIGSFYKGKFRFDTNGDHRITKDDYTVRLGPRGLVNGTVTDINDDGQDDLAIRRLDGKWRVDFWNGIEYGTFASALGDAGMKFFGAFWCHHCNVQKTFFKSGVDQLPYIECSTGCAGTDRSLSE